MTSWPFCLNLSDDALMIADDLHIVCRVAFPTHVQRLIVVWLPERNISYGHSFRFGLTHLHLFFSSGEGNVSDNYRRKGVTAVRNLQTQSPVTMIWFVCPAGYRVERSNVMQEFEASALTFEMVNKHCSTSKKKVGKYPVLLILENWRFGLTGKVTGPQNQ